MKFNIPLAPGAVTQFLLRVVTCLVVISFLSEMTVYFLPGTPSDNYFVKVFSVDSERNIPTAYSVLALLFSSLLLGVIAYAKNLDSCRYKRHWKILSFIFLYLSLDEAGQLHENLINPMRSLLNTTTGFLYFTWIVPFGFLVALFLISYSKFLLHLPLPTKKMFVAACALYIGGALGMELLGGYQASKVGEDNIVYQIIVTVEESLEMLGIVVFIHALMSYIKIYLGGVSWNIYIPGKNPQFTDDRNIGLAGISEPANTSVSR
ncbi:MULTISPECIES: hypothetical protein [unclassified Microcoleus]|uniref:hypothetical protein n=1 Tax=unclassified Microcoleus TaxID=2642155 RepID=UPI002FD62797